MAVLTPLPRFIAFDALGAPLAFGTVTTYAAGTFTPKATYTDQGGGTPNINPTTLDASGSASIWLDGAYKIDIKDSSGVSLAGYPVDNVIGYNQLDWTGLTATVAELNATNTSTKPVSITYAVLLSDRGKTILCDATAAGFDVDLLNVSTATNGYEITIKKTDVSTNIVTIDGFGGQTIEGRATFLLYDQNDVVTLLCDGSNWRIKSAFIRGAVVYQSAAFATTISSQGLTYVATAASAGYTITLVSAVTAGNGFSTQFKKGADVFDIVLDPAGAETIDGQTDFTLSSPYQYVRLTSDGANWIVDNNSHSNTSGGTGDVKGSYATTAENGWVILDDGTIGDATSGATTRANADTEDLFTLLWNNVTNAYCPVFTSAGVISTRGVSAALDFAAHKRIQLPLTKGRATAGAGTGTVNLTFTADSGTDLLTFQSNQVFYTGTAFTVANSGGALPTPLAAATTYYAIYQSATTIKVATTLANAIAGTAIDITANGSGTNTATITLTARALGEYVGEETHGVTISEMPSHTHSYNQIVTGPTGIQGGATDGDQASATSGAGGSTAHNNMQPTTFLNYFIKL